MRLAVDLLELSGFNVLSFGKAPEALKTLESIIPDLILVDINLPVMNGFEAHKKIRENHALDNIKVAAMSASVMKEDEARIMADGFDAFIKKPIDIKIFVTTVEGLIKK